MRVLIAAIVGAIIVFIWSAAAHMATPLGTAGVAMLPNEDQVVETLRTNVTKSAVYIFPGMDMQKQPTAEEQKAWEEKLGRGPSGLLVYTAKGLRPPFPNNLIYEFLTVFFSSLIAAIVISRTVGSWFFRAFVVAMFALFTFFSVSASHWIWYHFPTEFICAELIMEFVGYLLAGVAMAKIVPPPAFTSGP